MMAVRAMVAATTFADLPRENMLLLPLQKMLGTIETLAYP